jgi:hypothetical protein
MPLPRRSGRTPMSPVDAQLIGASARFQEVLARILRFSSCDAPVLIEDETGNRPDLHYRSARRCCPFVPINCAMLPEQLVVSEIRREFRAAVRDYRRLAPPATRFISVGSQNAAVESPIPVAAAASARIPRVAWTSELWQVTFQWLIKD